MYVHEFVMRLRRARGMLSSQLGRPATDDELAETLKSNSALTKLDLRQNSIGNAGATALAEALKSNSALTRLDLEGNSISDTTRAKIQADLALKSQEKTEL